MRPAAEVDMNKWTKSALDNREMTKEKIRGVVCGKIVYNEQLSAQYKMAYV